MATVARKPKLPPRKKNGRTSREAAAAEGLSTVTPAGIAALDPDALPPYARQAKDWNLTVDPEFEAAQRPLSADEYTRLEKAIVAYGGCRDAVVIAEIPRISARLILDGHNRVKICQVWGLPFRVIRLKLPDRAAALEWIRTNQLARRNLTTAERDELLARDYAALAKPRGRPKHGTEEGAAHRAQGTENKMGHAGPIKKSTAERVAEKHGVSPRTVKRAVETQRAKQELANGAYAPHPTLKELSHSQVKQLAKLPLAERAKALDGGKDAVKAALKQQQTQSTGVSSLSTDRTGSLAADRRRTYRELLAEFRALADRQIDLLPDGEIDEAINAWCEAGRQKGAERTAARKRTTKSTKRKPR